ncbi:spore coat U domain-containing protein [Edaphobacter paludis]|uniref:Spore coat U domain-containing protein n=2 Tax=Edaphobacter paludis TaxID=3035702 RepID=A0AAU7DC36_9BACT
MLFARAAGATCSVSAMSINFGTYSGSLLTPGGTPLTVTCPAGSSYSVGLNAGVGAGATVTTREMTGPGSAALSYQIFQDSARTTNWGNIVGTDTVAGTGDGSAQTIYIYPQAPGGQNVAPGTYNDTITVTVNYTGGTATTTFSVTATVMATCQISAASINFGNYTGSLVKPGGSPLTVTCTNTTSYDLGLSAGLGAGATVTSRKMTGPASAMLDYQMFQDSAQTLNWGNTVGTDTVHGISNGSTQTVYIYPQMAAGQNVAPGTYSDTVIVTVTY